MSEFKVGDKVRALKDDWDITKGNVYEVTEVGEHGDVFVIDDVGDSRRFISSHNFKLVSTAPDTDTYARILEAMLGEELVTMAKRIAEAV